jgi:hypothetical protein
MALALRERLLRAKLTDDPILGKPPERPAAWCKNRLQ